MTQSFLPYGRHVVDEADIAAVVEVLRSDWLTTGPKVAQFEQAVADFVGGSHAVAVASGTAALHAVMHAIGIGPGDEVIVPAMTFAATANSVVFQGGTPVFADVEPETLLIDPDDVEKRISARTKAIVAVDYAGQPCDYNVLGVIAKKHRLALVADACHSLGGEYKGRKVGTLADLTVFSFHPVKHITTGEGGMVVTNSAELTDKIRRFRNHGISTDFRQREHAGTFYYEMTELGYNYRITDIQYALGEQQLAKLPQWLERRRTIAGCYDEQLASMAGVSPLGVSKDIRHAFHLYVVRLAARYNRRQVFRQMRDSGTGVNVHYLPVYLHPFYRERFGYSQGLCPVAEAVYEQIISLPIWPGMHDDHVERVVMELCGALG